MQVQVLPDGQLLGARLRPRGSYSDVGPYLISDLRAGTNVPIRYNQIGCFVVEHSAQFICGPAVDIRTVVCQSGPSAGETAIPCSISSAVTGGHALRRRLIEPAVIRRSLTSNPDIYPYDTHE